MPDNNVILDELCNIIVKNSSSIIPFVGAGFSRFGESGTKLPLWSELIDSLIEFAKVLKSDSDKIEEVKKLRESQRYMAAMSAVHRHIGPTQFKLFVKKELSKQKIISPAILELIVIEWSLIVTTNLDTAIEQAYERENRIVPRVLTSNQRTELTETILGGLNPSNSLTIAKIHGSLNDYASWCLTRSDYRKLINDEQYMNILKGLFMKKILFIGFGLSDEDFDIVYDYLKRIYGGLVQESYAILPDAKKVDSRIEKLIHLGIKPIYYSVNPSQKDDSWGGHKGMYDCIRKLTKAWSESKSNLEIVLDGFERQDYSKFIGRISTLNKLSELVLEMHKSVQLVGYGGEGKTTLIQEWIFQNNFKIADEGFEFVFGYSFYSGSIEGFLLKSYRQISGKEDVLDVPTALFKFQKLFDNSDRKILFVLDGCEVLLNEEHALIDPYINRFLNYVGRSFSQVVITSRVPIPGPFMIIQVKPFEWQEIERSIDDKIITNGISKKYLKSIYNLTDGHILSLKVCFALLNQKINEEHTYSILENKKFQTFRLHQDQLTFNKLQHTLDTLRPILSDAELSFLICFSVFRKPASIVLVERMIFLSEKSELFTIALDLRKIILQLNSYGLISETKSGLLTTHPNVRSYFHDYSNPKIREMHFFAMNALIENIPDKKPVALADLEYHIEACYHAIQSKSWSQLHLIFFKYINLEYEEYLVDILGAWNISKEIAFQALDNGIHEEYETYYTATYARALKHLGDSRDSSIAYCRCLSLCGKFMHEDSALYLNNFLTLKIYTGELHIAYNCSRWNFLLLKWIKVKWKYHWQLEHGAFSIGWLFILVGYGKKALELYEIGLHAWSQYEGNHKEIFDHYPLYYVEFFLNETKPNYEKAIEIIEIYMKKATKFDWPETLIRGHIAISQLNRTRFDKGERTWQRSMQNSKTALNEARVILNSLVAPPMEIELLLEEIAHNFTFANFDEAIKEIINNQLIQLHQLIKTLHWNLFLPESYSYRGLYWFYCGKEDKATKFFKLSQAEFKKQGNVFFQTNLVRGGYKLRKALKINFDSGLDINIPIDIITLLTNDEIIDGSLFSEEIHNGLLSNI